MDDFPDPTGRIYGRRPYEKIGRCIVAWCAFEQMVISQTFLSRDPTRRRAFEIGTVQQGFEKKWNDWSNIHRPFAQSAAEFENFHKEVKELNTFRDDLSHNITDVFIGEDGFSIQIWRRTYGWREKFDRWASKYGHLPSAARPAGPYTAQLFLRYERDFDTFLDDLKASDKKARELSAALVRAAQA